MSPPPPPPPRSPPFFLSLPLMLPLLLLLSLHPTSSLSDAGPHAHSIEQTQMLMDPLEKETLFRIMEAMSSDRDWRGSTPDPCVPGSSWPGIECKPSSTDGRFHVARLDFGASPNPSCKSDAAFPSRVFDLPFLGSLFFFDCFRAARTTLSFPPPEEEAPAYASLQQLSLRSNPALVGAIPPRISSFKSLRVLALSQNQLHGRIPEGIGELTSLVHLDLSYNSLSGTIPPQMGGLKSLVGLDLSYNSLAGTIPPTIGRLGLLQKLDLSSNKLTGSIPESVESLNYLVFLALSNNRLSGRRFPDGLQMLQNLQYFIMDGNPMFIPLPSQLGRLANLQELRLANSGYSGTIPGSFAGLSNLTSLSLENNNLTGEIPVGLSGLGRMYHLNLSRNMLSGVVPFDVGFLKRLGRNLDLSGNVGLCFNDSESYETARAGVDVCGDHNTGAFAASSSSMQKPLGGVGGGSSLPRGLFHYRLLGLISVWGWYYVLL